MKRILWAAALLTLTACNTTPVRRVHSAASLPRVLDIAPAEFRDEEPRTLGAQFGTAYGTAYSDPGNVHNSLLTLAGVNFRTRRFAAGFLPYYAAARVSHEGTAGFGAAYWLAYHFGGGQKWRFSFQSSVAYMSKVAEEKGCENDSSVLVLGLAHACGKAPESRTRAEVRATEVGLVLSAERRLSQRGSLLFAPGAYWAKVDSGNQLDFDPSGNYDRHLRAWNPGLQLGYVLRFEGESANTALVFLAGAQWVKRFHPVNSSRAVLPSVDMRYLF